VGRFFLKAFWGTIIFLLLVYAGVMIYINRTAIFPNTEKNLTKDLIQKIQQNSPYLIQIVQDSSNESKEQIRQLIDKEIEVAYKPLLDQVDNFTTFHYSVRGEYTEIYYILTNQFDELLRKELFEPANFDENIKDALNRINYSALQVINSSLTTTQTSFQTLLGLDKNATAMLFDDLLNFSVKDIILRYEINLTNSIKGVGTGGGALGGALLGKAIAKKLSQKTLLKGGTKLGAKVLVSAESALSTSTVGALGGPVGAFLGGVIGAVGGWIASDAAIIAAEKKLTSQEFKKELQKLLTEQKEHTKETLYKIYLNKVQSWEQNLTKQIEKVKSQPIKEMLR